MLKKKSERTHQHAPDQEVQTKKTIKLGNKAAAACKDTVRLSADIQETLHCQLKMYCAQKRQSILEVLEQWITEHCTDTPVTR